MLRSNSVSNKLWRRVHRLAHSLVLRAELFCELDRAARMGTAVPKDMRTRLWKKPALYEVFVRLLRFINPDETILLLDVGGHEGQWCNIFLSFFPNTAVCAFEPVSHSFRIYKERFAKNSNISVYQVALSDREGEGRIHVGRSSDRSSLLNYTRREREAFQIDFVESQAVKLDRLDNYASAFFNTSKRVLKIDVQGYEVNVLNGSKATLPSVDIVVLECSFAEQYYETLPSFPHAVSILLDFNLYPVVFIDYGRTLSQYAWERDVIFVKHDLLERIWGW